MLATPGRQGVGQGINAGQFHQLTGGDAFIQRRCAHRFNADDRDIGSQGLGRQGRAGDQAAAADGNQQNIRIRCVGENFQADRALPRDDVRVGEGMDIGLPGPRGN